MNVIFVLVKVFITNGWLHYYSSPNWCTFMSLVSLGYWLLISDMNEIIEGYFLVFYSSLTDIRLWIQQNFKKEFTETYLIDKDM